MKLQTPQTPLMILFMGALWGTTYPLIKIADSYGIPKFSYIFWESLGVVLLLLPFVLIKKQLSKDFFESYKYHLFLGVSNIALSQTLFFFIAKQVDSALLNVIVVLTPVFTYSISLLLGHDSFSKEKATAVIVGFCGAYLLFTPDDITNSGTFLWVLLAFSLPINYAANNIVASKLRPTHVPASALCFGLFFVAAVIMLALSIAFNQFHIPFSGPRNPGDYAILGHVFVSLISYYLFFTIAKSGKAIFISLGFYVMSIVGIAWGITFFNEELDAYFWVSALLIFLSLFLINRGKFNQKES